MTLSVIFLSTLFADTPSDNDIPTLAMRIRGPDLIASDITLELLCELSWLNFDAVNFSGPASSPLFQNLMSLCDRAGMYYSICPNEIMQYLKEWAAPEFRFWLRYSNASLTSDSAFGRWDSSLDSIVQYMPADSMYCLNETISIKTTIEGLAEITLHNDFLWFYEVYDEANSQQGGHGANYQVTLTWDDYIPNVYTQARDSITGYPTLEEVEASSIFSIQKHYSEDTLSINPVTFTMNFGLLHSIDTTEYTGLPGNKGWTTMVTQAMCVRAMMEAEYQGLPSGQGTPLPVDNPPEYIMFDYYPFRYVHPGSGTAEMCDPDWLFLIDHFEEGIDSTVIPAQEYNCPVYYFPQTFGKAGGPNMYDSSGYLNYLSYYHRNPAPGEFRMLCNLALLHQAKGIFPYNLCSYLEFDENGPCIIMSSLLDRHNIPFDADYEEWVYTGRWPDDSLAYIRPDSIPPWIDGYDPLFSLNTPPDTTARRDPKNKEIWYEWHFAPYAALYNNIYDILAEVKIIGPEMHDLWWWKESGTAYWDVAEITVPDSSLLDNYVSPRIRIFYNASNDHAYLFYVNRYCGEYYMGNTDQIPVHISIEGSQLPGSPGNPYLFEQALDHSRRCLIPITEGPGDLYYFEDTLAAGQSRLIEFIDTSSVAQADLRITSPDVFCYPAGNDGRNTEFRCTSGDTLNLAATFYNMGTDSTGTVDVTFTDVSGGGSTVIGRDTLSLDGLSSFFEPDSASAIILWSTDSTDIGVHIIEISADTVSGEDTFDNSLFVTVLVEPRDYATYVRGDSWDMDYDSTSSWHTCDIEDIDFNWDTTATGWTDSVSGMFEGVINYDTSTGGFRGDISLAIPQDSTIDSDIYHMLSFGIVGNNVNNLTGGAFDMHIRWKDTYSQWHGWEDLLGEDFSVGDGWDEYSVIGPIDLNSIDSLDWGDDDVSELWLSIRAECPFTPGIPIDVRIGWFRLEESAQ